MSLHIQLIQQGKCKNCKVFDIRIHHYLMHPQCTKSSIARQKNMKNLFKCGVIKETMGCLITKFFIYESVPPSKADSHHFKNMIVGAQQAGNYYNFKSCIHFNNIITIYIV